MYQLQLVQLERPTHNETRGQTPTVVCYLGMLVNLGSALGGSHAAALGDAPFSRHRGEHGEGVLRTKRSWARRFCRES